MDQWPKGHTVLDCTRVHAEGSQASATVGSRARSRRHEVRYAPSDGLVVALAASCPPLACTAPQLPTARGALSSVRFGKWTRFGGHRHWGSVGGMQCGALTALCTASLPAKNSGAKPNPAATFTHCPAAPSSLFATITAAPSVHWTITIHPSLAWGKCRSSPVHQPDRQPAMPRSCCRAPETLTAPLPPYVGIFNAKSQSPLYLHTSVLTVYSTLIPNRRASLSQPSHLTSCLC